MSRWILALLYALMLICAALPASAQVQADSICQQADALGMDGDAGAPNPAEPGSFDGPFDAPELFAALRVDLPAVRQSAAPPSVSEALPAAPCLEGLQRPPRAHALTA